jgi:hypothetical protein
VDKETETLLSIAVLLKAGFDVKRKRDPTFGGYLVTPDGQDSHDFWQQSMALAYVE